MDGQRDERRAPNQGNCVLSYLALLSLCILTAVEVSIVGVLNELSLTHSFSADVSGLAVVPIFAVLIVRPSAPLRWSDCDIIAVRSSSFLTVRTKNSETPTCRAISRLLKLALLGCKNAIFVACRLSSRLAIMMISVFRLAGISVCHCGTLCDRLFQSLFCG